MGLNLESTISLNSASFERGMNRVKSTVTDSIKNFAIGAIGIATVEEAFRRTVETADELVNTAKRLGTTVEQVQLLRQAAKDAGQEMDTVSTALEKINQARAKALGGDRAASAAFGALGVSQTDLKTKTAADLFMHEISETVKRVSPEQIAQPLREVLGRGAGQGIAVLKTDFEELGRKMQESGAIMSGEVAAKLKQLSEGLSFFGTVLIAQLAPAILWTANALLVLLKSALNFAEWVDKKTGLGDAAKISGAMSNQTDLKGQAKILGSILIQDIKNGGKITEEQRQSILKANGVDPAKLDKDVKDSKGDPFTAFADKTKAAIDALLSGKIKGFDQKPDFDATEETARKMKGGGKIESDSLVKVGNFLGSNIGAVHSAARMERSAAETAANTRQIAQILTHALMRDKSAMTDQQRAHKFMSINKDVWGDVPNNP